MKFLFLAALLFAVPSASDPVERPLDVVQFSESKKKVTGRVVYMTPETLFVREKSRLNEYERSEVSEFSSVNQELIFVMPELAKVTTALETTGMEELAQSCEERGLVAEARLVWWNILRLEPENEAAHEELGHRISKKKWQAKFGKKWWKMEKIAKEKPKWKNRFELSTTHFDIESNLLWHDTVRAAVMAEEIYVALYHAFGSELELYWPSETMEIYLHGDGSYNAGADLRAAVDIGSHRVAYDFEEGFQAWLFARHLSELLVGEAIKEKGGGRAVLPLWMAIGIEESLQSYLGLADTNMAVIDFDLTRVNTYNMQLHADAKKPYDFTRVINFGGGDFRNADNELQRAQAYTLFAYCMRGEDGAHKEGLMEYYAHVMEARGSSTTFKECLGARGNRAEKKFEAAWHAWVKP